MNHSHSVSMLCSETMITVNQFSLASSQMMLRQCSTCGRYSAACNSLSQWLGSHNPGRSHDLHTLARMTLPAVRNEILAASCRPCWCSGAGLLSGGSSPNDQPTVSESASRFWTMKILILLTVPPFPKPSIVSSGAC